MTNEHRWGQGPLTDLKIGQNLDFLKLGQRRLGTSVVVRVDIKVVPIGPLRIFFLRPSLTVRIVDLLLSG